MWAIACSYAIGGLSVSVFHLSFGPKPRVKLASACSAGSAGWSSSAGGGGGFAHAALGLPSSLTCCFSFSASSLAPAGLGV